jgi:methylphosphotriester-DNA--protein-cysteine methyltransferase
MLQNRVNPYSQLISTPARGAWMGNRGLLHDEATAFAAGHRPCFECRRLD